jgi:hypothetical protein
MSEMHTTSNAHRLEHGLSITVRRFIRTPVVSGSVRTLVGFTLIECVAMTQGRSPGCWELAVVGGVTFSHSERDWAEMPSEWRGGDSVRSLDGDVHTERFGDKGGKNLSSAQLPVANRRPCWHGVHGRLSCPWCQACGSICGRQSVTGVQLHNGITGFVRLVSIYAQLLRRGLKHLPGRPRSGGALV